MDQIYPANKAKDTYKNGFFFNYHRKRIMRHIRWNAWKGKDSCHVKIPVDESMRILLKKELGNARYHIYIINDDTIKISWDVDK